MPVVNGEPSKYEAVDARYDCAMVSCGREELGLV